MALIPPDAAVRLRLQTDSSLPAVAALKPLPADLPDLGGGQRFTARILQLLPENSYRALVDGREITLSLPNAVGVGETLDLVVVERSSRTVIAQLAGTSTAPLKNVNAAVRDDVTPALSTTRLSSAGLMIGKLLLASGEQPLPVTLNNGEPLLAQPLPQVSDIAATLAPRLQQAAALSGLFYEAHQALWLSAQHTTEALMEEPQARHAVIHGKDIATKTPVQLDGRDSANVHGINPARSATDDASVTSASHDLMQSIPGELRPLVQQQLDAAATQRVTWQGEVWPGQTMQWEISRDAPERSASSDDTDQRWNTSLALTTPRLGRVDAALGIAGNSVRIRLTADSTTSSTKLSSHLANLITALEAAGLNPVGLQVQDVNA